MTMNPNDPDYRRELQRETSEEGMSTAAWAGIAIEGVYEHVFHENGLGKGWKGLYATSMLEAHSAWRGRADMFSEILKLGVLAGEHMHAAYRGRYYAKAQNLSTQLRAAYDKALAQYDLLLMPTSPLAGVKLPPQPDPPPAPDPKPGPESPAPITPSE